MNIIRWLLFLPLGFIAAVFFGFIATSVGEFLGGATWWVWAISGAASGGAFIVVALHVAPPNRPAAKWITFSVVAVLGFMAAAGPILVGEEVARSTAGFAMILAAFYVLRPGKQDETRT